MIAREKPYFWVTWLVGLLSGEEQCEWKVWLKSHYQNYEKTEDRGNLSEWEIAHTALLNETSGEYKAIANKVFQEAKWVIEGRSADVGGKIDLLVVGPNFVIDAKTGQKKTSHAVQVKIYLLAIEMGAVDALDGLEGEFKGLLVYKDGKEIPVAGPVEEFNMKLFALIKRLANNKPKTSPSELECRFCDIKDCKDRFVKKPAATTELF